MMYIPLITVVIYCIIAVTIDFFIGSCLSLKVLKLEKSVKALEEECKRLDDNQWNLIHSVEFEYRKYFEELGIVFLENRLDCKTCKDIGYCPECPYLDPD